jgi:hypothetical protein
MKVNLSRRSVLLILGAIAAVLVALAVWSRPQHGVEPSAESATHGAPAAESAVEHQVAAETQEDTAEDAERMDPAKRIVHVPDTRVAATEADAIHPDELSSSEIVEFAAEAVEEALNGNLTTTRRRTDLLHFCVRSVPHDEGALEDRVLELSQWVANGAAAGNPIPPEGIAMEYAWLGEESLEIRLFPNDSQNRRHLMEWYQGCAGVDRLFGGDMRARLQRLARNGHVTARYLYAMWRPQPYPLRT